jgi:hypothetical protein
MVSKCANPKRRAVFQYFHEGKLFEFEVRTLDELFGEEPGPENHETQPQSSSVSGYAPRAL